MRRLLPLSCVLILLGVERVSAQQEPQFTHFTWNQLVYNPGYAGSRDAICATLVYHNQWASFTGPDKEGAPITQTFSIHAPLKNHRIGAGVHVLNDKEGFIGTTGFYLDGAYRRVLPFGAELGVGLTAGMIQKSLQPNWHAKDAGDTRLPGTTSSSGLDAGAGVHLLGSNWYVGLSALHLNQSKLSWGTIDYPVASSYWLTAGYNQQGLMGGNMELRPAVLVKTDFAKTTYAVNVQAMYKERFWAALNYRAEAITALSAMVGLYALQTNTGQLAIGYSYDIATKNASVFGGTHELMAQYCFNLSFPTVPDVWHKTPRFL
jgi:type IX secretion system PorP/SprF family membrane protein